MLLVILLIVAFQMASLTVILPEPLDVSRTNDVLDDITGVIVYNGGYFLLCLEGRRRAVSKRFTSITADMRHKHLAIPDFSQTAERRFPAWRM